jgi:asparagine synthase (glutamine-hydrolysing)
MCGIIGIFGASDAVELAKEGLSLLKHRGMNGFGICTEDDFRFSRELEGLNIGRCAEGTSRLPFGQRPSIDSSQNVLAHSLHSVVNFVEQPIVGRGRLVSNCEIYNWKELKKKYGLNARNDAELLFKLLEKRGIDVIDEIDGDYAFAYWTDGRLYLARDKIGIKPVWYSSSPFAFASERKVLLKLGFEKVHELNPRQILVYDLERRRLSAIKRDFPWCISPMEKTLDEMMDELAEYIRNAVLKRVPDCKFGLLFSGGIDSTVISLVLREMGFDFTCYTSALDDPGMKKAEDLIYAEKVAKELGFDLKMRKIGISEVEDYLREIVPLIESTDVTKVGVALPIYLACEMAKEDGVKVIFSGLGSEEIFAGYERHKRSEDVNKECIYGLLKIYERDTYRDDLVAMANGIELRVPFLDEELVDYAIKIPARFKIDASSTSGNEKVILRLIAKKFGLNDEFAWRKKRAAQYGSNFDKAIEKLAKRNGSACKSDYLRQFHTPSNLRLGVLFSSGKDSVYALNVMMRRNYLIACLITVKSKNPYSYMFHTPGIDLTALQAEAMDIPLVVGTTDGEEGRELLDLRRIIEMAREEYDLDGIVSGALFSCYQRDRIEMICDELGLKVFSPLWHKDQESEMRELIKGRFNFIFTSIACYGLNKDWLGREIKTEEVDKLVSLEEKIGLNIAGEGGEFESLVLDGPIFKRRVEIGSSEIVEEDENTARLMIYDAILVDKATPT